MNSKLDGIRWFISIVRQLLCYTFDMKYTTILLILLVSGCTHVATYPPVENKAALNLSNTSAKEPVPTIMAETIVYAHERFGGMDTIVFNLPVGISEETYSTVANKIGGAIPMSQPDQVAYHIIELRVRGYSAEADVVFPSTTNKFEMATIKLKTSILDPWAVTDYRIWNIPVSKTMLPNMSKADVAEVGLDQESK